MWRLPSALVTIAMSFAVPGIVPVLCATIVPAGSWALIRLAPVAVSAGNADFKLGVRLDHYDGLTTKTLVQPRLGVSYAVPRSNTVLRASYGRTLETPYNENLLLSSGLGLNGVFGDGQILEPGKRNQGESRPEMMCGVSVGPRNCVPWCSACSRKFVPVITSTYSRAPQ
jgi:TonB dependent receptor